MFTRVASPNLSGFRWNHICQCVLAHLIQNCEEAFDADRMLITDNSNIEPNSSPLLMLRNLSELDFHLSRSHHFSSYSRSIYFILFLIIRSKLRKSQVHPMTSNDLEHYKVKRTPYINYYYPRLPNFAQNRFQIIKVFGFFTEYNGEFEIFEKKSLKIK